MSRWRILLPFAAGSLQEDDYIDINARHESVQIHAAATTVFIFGKYIPI
ncbi:MAG: hypothetical protein U0223_09720 [Nitrospira sp.]